MSICRSTAKPCARPNSPPGPARGRPARMPGQHRRGRKGTGGPSDRPCGPPVYRVLFQRGRHRSRRAVGSETGLSRGPVPFRLIPLTRHLASDAPGLTAWDHTGRLFALYGAQPGTLYLARPDGHVLGRWRTAEPAEIWRPPLSTPCILDRRYKERDMTDSELDSVYTQLCKTMTDLGEARSSLFLARFALLAVTEIGRRRGRAAAHRRRERGNGKRRAGNGLVERGGSV